MTPELQAEINQLNQTDYGIIGQVKEVQYNPDKYPELMHYSFYEIRRILEDSHK